MVTSLQVSGFVKETHLLEIKAERLSRVKVREGFRIRVKIRSSVRVLRVKEAGKIV